MIRHYEKFSILNESSKRIRFYDTRFFDIVNAEKRTYEDYLDEVVNGGNECAVLDCFCEMCDRKFIFWSDIETLEEFISEIE